MYTGRVTYKRSKNLLLFQNVGRIIFLFFSIKKRVVISTEHGESNMSLPTHSKRLLLIAGLMSYSVLALAGTQVIHYKPKLFKTNQVITGNCWTHSISANRKNAWRCTSNNAIYDPCFQIKHSDTLICNPNPATNN